MQSKHFNLSAGNLKFVALIFMLMDHIAKIFCPFYQNVPIGGYIYDILKGCGRISFPVFAFFIAEGCKKTHNIKRYLLRLFLISIISEPFYDFAFSDFNLARYFGNPIPGFENIQVLESGLQNVCFSFFLSAAAIYCWERYLGYRTFIKRRKTMDIFLLAMQWCVLYQSLFQVMKTVLFLMK